MTAALYCALIMAILFINFLYQSIFLNLLISYIHLTWFYRLINTFMANVNVDSKKAHWSISQFILHNCMQKFVLY
jgi:hypothetical protein